LVALNTEVVSGETAPPLDAHPLIREYFARQLRKASYESWRLGHSRVYHHLCEATPYLPATLTEMEPLFRAVTHGCAAGHYEEVWQSVVRDRIHRGDNFYGTRTLGAFGLQLAATASFFTTPWCDPVPELSGQSAAFAMYQAGYALRACGQLVDAVLPLRRSLAMHESDANWRGAAALASNLSEVLLDLGDINAAIDMARFSVRYADLTKDWYQRMGKRTTLADALHNAGLLSDARVEFESAERIQQEEGGAARRLNGFSGFRLCDYLVTTGKHIEAGERAEEALRIAQATGDMISIPLYHLIRGQSSLRMTERHQTGGCDYARAELDLAVTGLRLVATLDLLPRALVLRASLRFRQQDPGGSRTDLDEASEIAERGQMKLHMADTHLYRARLFFREAPYPWRSPQEDLAAAEKLINDCGYHRRDEELADAKRAILGT